MMTNLLLLGAAALLVFGSKGDDGSGQVAEGDRPAPGPAGETPGKDDVGREIVDPNHNRDAPANPSPAPPPPATTGQTSPSAGTQVVLPTPTTSPEPAKPKPKSRQQVLREGAVRRARDTGRSAPFNPNAPVLGIPGSRCASFAPGGCSVGQFEDDMRRASMTGRRRQGII